MPKNKGKGGKNRRRGKNENEGMKRELVFREDGQQYAQVRVITLFSIIFWHKLSVKALLDTTELCCMINGIIWTF